MMVAVLVGALSLGACVDDNESQSVTNVRNAKTEQLKAMAAHENALAEASLINANATKAREEACAEFYKAQAANQNADAATKEFELQQAKDKYAAELEAINLEAQNRLLAAKIEAAKQEQNFLTLANDLLKDLYRTYAMELTTLENYKYNLNMWNNQVAQLEAEVITTDQANAAQKAIGENENLGYQAKIDAYKAYEGKDKSELQAETEGLFVTYQTVHMDYLKAQASANTAKKGCEEVLNTFSAFDGKATLKTVLAVDALRELGFNSFNNEDFVIDEKANLIVIRYSLNSEAEVVRVRQQLTGIEKSAKERLGAKKAGETPASGLYADLEAAEKRLADAVTAKDEESIDRYTLEVAQWNDRIASTLKEIEEAAQNLKDFEAAIASFAGEDLKAYDDALAALKDNEAVVAYINAKAEEEKLEKAQTKAYANYEAADQLANNGVDAKEQILSYEKKIADNLANIAKIQNNAEESLERAKMQVAQYTTHVETQETVVELAKKNLDAAIAAQEE